MERARRGRREELRVVPRRGARIDARGRGALPAYTTPPRARCSTSRGASALAARGDRRGTVVADRARAERVGDLVEAGRHRLAAQREPGAGGFAEPHPLRQGAFGGERDAGEEFDRVPAALLRGEAVVAEFGAGVERDLAGGPDAEGIGEPAGGFGRGGELQQGVVVEQAVVGIGEGGQQKGVCFCDCLRRGSHGFNFTPAGRGRLGKRPDVDKFSGIGGCAQEVVAAGSRYGPGGPTRPTELGRVRDGFDRLNQRRFRQAQPAGPLDKWPSALLVSYMSNEPTKLHGLRGVR